MAVTVGATARLVTNTEEEEEVEAEAEVVPRRGDTCTLKTKPEGSRRRLYPHATLRR